MDSLIHNRAGGSAVRTTERMPAAGMPPESRAPMPAQSLLNFDPGSGVPSSIPRAHSRDPGPEWSSWVAPQR